MADPVVTTSFQSIVSNSMLQFCAVVVLLLMIIDQLRYILRKGKLPGAAYTIPFIGKLWASFFPKFEGYISQWNMGGVSCSSVLHKFIVFATSNDMARKVFNTPQDFMPAGVASMRTILRPDSWVFLTGDEHLRYRKQLLPLFKPEALAAYIPLLEEAYRFNIEKWLTASHSDVSAVGSEGPSKPLTLMMQFRIRDMNMTAALGAFCGRRYLPTGADVEMSEKFRILTFAMQLVNIPFAIKGTVLYDAVQARIKILELLVFCVVQARERMTSDETPESLLDHWLAHQKKVGETHSNDEIAMAIFSFIFASQDASTSSVVWALAILADHPEVLAKIREEQDQVRPLITIGGAERAALTFENISQMKYLSRVVKELLRYRPPVLMMPYEAIRDCQLGEHAITKGTIVIASVYPSLYDPQVYRDPEIFSPARFDEPQAEDKKNPQNYMVWGHGPHSCIGREYATIHLIGFIATLVTTCNWKHIRTANSEKIAILATTYPEDGCIIELTRR